ncbi:MAG: type II 3-dehydroquinate dehydratase [Acidimicrobiia bacterium]
MKVLILNGPNLNHLGSREPEIYGSETLADLQQSVSGWGTALGIETEFLQSNHEGALIDAIQQSEYDGIVINPGALTHTSRALADALRSVEAPVAEVHISNIKEREVWRAESVISDACVSTIYGRGISGYRDALRHLANRAAGPFETVRYGPHAENVGDLRIGERGLVVLVHGGFWRQEWQRDTTESLAVDLTERGFNTWNIEYRRIGNGGGWPGSAHDVLMALDFAPQLGLEVEKVAVVGHSAGGHLALWSVGRSQTEISQVVAMAPINDLVRHAESGMYGATEARALLESGAPPVSDPGEIATILAHGEDDRHVPFEHSSELAIRSGIDLITTPGGHFDLLEPRSDSWQRIVEAIDRSI